MNVVKNPLTIAQRAEVTRLLNRVITFISPDYVDLDEGASLVKDVEVLEDFPDFGIGFHG